MISPIRDRTDLVELIDSYFLDKYKAVKPLSDATINTESPAWAIDRLSILALKIYHMKQEVERTDTTEEHRAAMPDQAEYSVGTAERPFFCYRTLLADIEAGRKYMKVYKQMKMYNDPALNPVLYAKKITNGAYSHYPFLSSWRCSHDDTCDTFACCAISTARNHCIKSCRMATSFQSLPENVNFVGADLTGKHKGLWGLNSLYSELKRMHFDYVADFHHVLRSKYLCLRFRLANIPVAFICKGRAGKKKTGSPPS